MKPNPFNKWSNDEMRPPDYAYVTVKSEDLLSYNCCVMQFEFSFHLKSKLKSAKCSENLKPVFEILWNYEMYEKNSNFVSYHIPEKWKQWTDGDEKIGKQAGEEGKRDGEKIGKWV